MTLYITINNLHVKFNFKIKKYKYATFYLQPYDLHFNNNIFPWTDYVFKNTITMLNY